MNKYVIYNAIMKRLCILLSTFLLLSCLYTYADNKSRYIPKQVVKLAKKYGYKKNPDIRLFYVTSWNKYNVYEAFPENHNPRVIGLPLYILYDGRNARFSRPDEQTMIYNKYKSEIKVINTENINIKSLQEYFNVKRNEKLQN
jgi:hypothetical protein